VTKEADGRSKKGECRSKGVRLVTFMPTFMPLGLLLPAFCLRIPTLLIRTCRCRLTPGVSPVSVEAQSGTGVPPVSDETEKTGGTPVPLFQPLDQDGRQRIPSTLRSNIKGAAARTQPSSQKRFCTEDRKDHEEMVSDRAFNRRAIRLITSSRSLRSSVQILFASFDRDRRALTGSAQTRRL
jgi:hypothetical protein